MNGCRHDDGKGDCGAQDESLHSLAPHRLQKAASGSFLVPQPAQVGVAEVTAAGTGAVLLPLASLACNSRSMTSRYPLSPSSSCFMSASARVRSRRDMSSKSFGEIGRASCRGRVGSRAL